MTNDIAKKQNENYVARYENNLDGFENFARESSAGIVGQILRCSKGDWSVGADRDSVPPGLFLVLMPTMSRGWVKWFGNQIVDRRVSAVSDNVLIPHRYTLGDLDETKWEQNPDGTARDPWSPDYRVALIATSPPHAEFTFVGSSHGARIAFQDLCKEYAAARHEHQGCMPVVNLDIIKRQSQRYGVIKGPKFVVQGWATVEDVKAGRKAKAATRPMEKPKPKQPTQAEMEAELDDEIPDWGSKKKRRAG